MARTEVVNLNRGDAFDVYIGRTGKGMDGPFGNYVDEGQNRYQRVAAFRKDFLARIQTDEAYRQQVENLRGKRIGCFCAPLLCHGMIFVEYLENVSPEQQIEDYINWYIRKPSRSSTEITWEEPDMFEGL